MSDVQWPSLSDISLRLTGVQFDVLTAQQFGVVSRMIWVVAQMGVNTHYTDASPDPGLPDDEVLIRRMIRCGLAEWRASKKAALDFFEVSGGKWRLIDESVIVISRTGRSPIPLAVRMAALSRDGQCCVYCGNTDGPFHFDHLWPVSRGGRDSVENVVVACAPCNLSKNDRSLREWMEARGR